MKKLEIHTAGILDFFKQEKGKLTLTKEQAQEFEEFKKEIFTIYKKINNAYKLYFQGAKLKSRNPEYIVEKYRDEKGNVKERKVEKNTSTSKKIDFKGKWGFFLEDNKTSLGQAIHSLYAFLTKLDNIAYAVTNQQQKPEEKPAQQQPEEKKPEPEQQKPENKSPEEKK